MEGKTNKVFHPGTQKWLGRSLLSRSTAPDKHPWSKVPTAAALDDALTVTDLRTLILLCKYAGSNGCCYVAQSTLAKLRGVTRQMIAKSLSRLKYWVTSEPCYRPHTRERTSDWHTIHYRPLPERDNPVEDTTSTG